MAVPVKVYNIVRPRDGVHISLTSFGRKPKVLSTTRALWEDCVHRGTLTAMAGTDTLYLYDDCAVLLDNYSIYIYGDANESVRDNICSPIFGAPSSAYAIEGVLPHD